MRRVVMRWDHRAEKKKIPASERKSSEERPLLGENNEDTIDTDLEGGLSAHILSPMAGKGEFKEQTENFNTPDGFKESEVIQRDHRMDPSFAFEAISPMTIDTNISSAPPSGRTEADGRERPTLSQRQYTEKILNELERRLSPEDFKDETENNITNANTAIFKSPIVKNPLRPSDQPADDNF